MIRSALKSGFKKIADRVLGAPVPAPPPPAPAWKTSASTVAAPVVTAPAPQAGVSPEPAAPATEAPSPIPVVAPSPEPSSLQATLPAAEAPRTEAAPVDAATDTARVGGADAPATSRGKKAAKGAAASKRTRAAETAARLQAVGSEDAVVEAPVPTFAAPTEAPAAVPTESSAAPADTAPADDVVGPALSMEALQEVIDEMVRPALQGDGGDITLLRIEGGKVFVKLVGACSTCPSSIATLKLGVEALLKEEFPAIEELVQET